MKKKKDLIFGIHPVLEAIRSGRAINKILVKKGKQERVGEVVTEAGEAGIPVQKVPGVKLNKMSSGNHQGVVASISPVEFVSLEMLIPWLFEKGKDPFILILDGITDVRNFGGICRTAECCGVDAVLIPSKGSVEINSDALRTSSGALARLSISRVKDLSIGVQFLRESGLEVLGCHERAEEAVFSKSLKGPIGLVMGAEEKGIGEEVKEQCSGEVYIPMAGETGSFNVSVATGICLYEKMRQEMKSG